jgi:hypothetical protein
MRVRALLFAFGIVVVSGALMVGGVQTAKAQSEGDGSGNTVTVARDAAGNAVASALPNGWNVVQPKNCQMFDVSTGANFNVYDTQGNAFGSTTPQYQNAMIPACESGHFMAFYVYTSGSSQYWSSVYTWTY